MRDIKKGSSLTVHYKNGQRLSLTVYMVKGNKVFGKDADGDRYKVDFDMMYVYYYLPSTRKYRMNWMEVEAITY